MAVKQILVILFITQAYGGESIVYSFLKLEIHQMLLIFIFVSQLLMTTVVTLEFVLKQYLQTCRSRDRVSISMYCSAVSLDSSQLFFIFFIFKVWYICHESSQTNRSYSKYVQLQLSFKILLTVSCRCSFSFFLHFWLDLYTLLRWLLFYHICLLSVRPRFYALIALLTHLIYVNDVLCIQDVWDGESWPPKLISTAYDNDVDDDDEAHNNP